MVTSGPPTTSWCDGEGLEPSQALVHTFSHLFPVGGIFTFTFLGPSTGRRHVDLEDCVLT